MDNYIVAGDQVIFLPAFGPAIITPIPGVMISSATKTMVTKKPVCLEGDEKKVVVPGVAYISGAFVVPGVGTLTIDKLQPDQLSRKTKIEGKAPILKGMMFVAKFQVTAPAQQPPAPPKPPVPDPVATYMGQGMFIPTDMTVMDKG
jgi:hypothetical protein